MQGGVWEECWGPLPGAADPPPCRCPPSASQVASVLRGSTRTPAGSACPLMSAHASLQGSPTPGAPSSTPTVRLGKPQPHPGDPGGPGMSSGSLGMAGGPPPTPCRSASCGGTCVPGRPETPERPAPPPAPAQGASGHVSRASTARPPAPSMGKDTWSPSTGSGLCSMATANTFWPR